MFHSLRDKIIAGSIERSGNNCLLEKRLRRVITLGSLRGRRATISYVQLEKDSQQNWWQLQLLDVEEVRIEGMKVFCLESVGWEVNVIKIEGSVFYLRRYV